MEVIVAICEPFFWTSRTVSAVAATLASGRSSEGCREVHGSRQDNLRERCACVAQIRQVNAAVDRPARGPVPAINGSE
jgi:hypothetical protein